MRIIVLLALTAPLFADSRALQRKAERQRTAEYHRLNAKSKQAATDMRAFVEQWGRECQAKGQELKLDATGDPGCEIKQAASIPIDPKK